MLSIFLRCWYSKGILPVRPISGHEVLSTLVPVASQTTPSIEQQPPTPVVTPEGVALPNKFQIRTTQQHSADVMVQETWASANAMKQEIIRIATLCLKVEQIIFFRWRRNTLFRTDTYFVFIIWCGVLLHIHGSVRKIYHIFGTTALILMKVLAMKIFIH